MSRLAELLKNRREELKKTVAEVSSDTKIRVQFIENIDNGQFKLLPSYLHAYGFVKKYAEYLGIPYDEIKDLFNEECPKDGPLGDENHNNIPNGVEEKRGITPIILALVLVVLCVGIWFGYSAYSPKDKLEPVDSNEAVPVLEDGVPVEPNNIEQPAESTQTENTEAPVISGSTGEQNINTAAATEGTNNPEMNTTSETASNTSNSTPLAAQAAPIEPIEKESSPQPDKTEKYITLSFSGDCWVRFVSDTGKTDDFMANKNTVEELAFINSFTISIGNAAAISMKYGSQDFTNFGTEGKAIKNLRYVLKDGVLTVVNN